MDSMISELSARIKFRRNVIAPEEDDNDPPPIPEPTIIKTKIKTKPPVAPKPKEKKTPVQCPICSNPFETSHKEIKLGCCDARFHNQCRLDWFNRNKESGIPPTCASCRCPLDSSGFAIEGNPPQGNPPQGNILLSLTGGYVINPFTKRRIKIGGPTYIRLSRELNWPDHMSA